MPELSRAQLVVYARDRRRSAAARRALAALRTGRRRSGGRVRRGRARGLRRFVRARPRRRWAWSSTSPARSSEPGVYELPPAPGSPTRSSAPGARPARRPWTRSTWRRSSPTASRWSSRLGSEPRGAAPAARRRGRPDQPRHRDRRATRHDRGHRAGDRRRTSSTTATSTAGSRRSTSSTRSAGSARRRWRRCATGSSPDPKAPTSRRRLAPQLGVAWRAAAVAGFAAGLAATPVLGAPPGWTRPLAIAASLAAIGLAIAAPRNRDDARWRPGVTAVLWLALVGATAGAAGVALATARLAAIDAGALRAEPGSRVRVRGFVVAVPRRADGEVDVRVETPAGRLLVEAPEPLPDLDIGAAVSATRDAAGAVGVRGALPASPRNRAGALDPLDRARRAGARRGQRDARPGPGARAGRTRRRHAGGVGGSAARLRPRPGRPHRPGNDRRTSSAPGSPTCLRSPARTSSCSRCSRAAALALLGVGARARLVWILALIAIYVRVTGAGPSIQRAGVMGAAAVVAALADRPRSRWYALLLAACATLAVDPRAAADVGWQLSFAAVVGHPRSAPRRSRACSAGRGAGAGPAGGSPRLRR